MSEYTKGEWSYRAKDRYNGVIIDNNGELFALIQFPMRKDGKNIEANAHLIAAAPDLLTACKAALEFIGRSNKTDWDNEITPILQEAIAKAKP